MEKQKFYLIFLICMLAIGIYSFKLGDFNLFSKTAEEAQEVEEIPEPTMKEEEIPETSKNKDEYSDTKGKAITVNQPIALGGKTKAQIYALRKKYVQKSIFASANYKPSDEVFGEIVDGKPWLSVDVCEKIEGQPLIGGASEESRFIANPALLVAIEYPFFQLPSTDPDFCAEQRTKMIPQSIRYIADKKTIVVTYENLPFSTRDKSTFYTFNGLNARDLGYKYVHIDNRKSNYRPDFTENDNISSGVKEFQNYIHTGGSCKQPGGCNNGSPRQSFLEFRNDSMRYRYNNRVIYIKLWKNMPASPDSQSDITEVIKLGRS